MVEFYESGRECGVEYWSISMPVLEEEKLLFKEKLANEISIDSTDDLA